MNKLQGIQFLKAFHLPTVELYDVDFLLSGNFPITEPLSVRLSPKSSNRKSQNVYLPSIHNCTDLFTIKEFINLHRQQYDVFVHKTVSPTAIGSISKLNEKNCIVLESYKDFSDRKKEIIKNQMIIPLMGFKPYFSQLELLKKDPKDFHEFKKVLYYLRDIPFQEFDMEYVIENNDNVIFTDLTLPSQKEYFSVCEYLNEQKIREQ